MDKARVLFLHAPSEIPQGLPAVLDHGAWEVLSRPADATALEWVVSLKPDVVFLHHTGNGTRNWQEVAGQVRQADPATPLILLTLKGSEELAVAALRLGLQDYLTLPLSAEAALQAVQRCRRSPRNRNSFHPANGCPVSDAGLMVGENSSLGRVKLFMANAAAADCAVLITGETGTGKELAAQFIHRSSPRKGKPFVCVNCAAIPDTLLESELFGHARGAFTGAQDLHNGLLVAADGGTVFLDEIGDMSLFAQAKILRVLETKEVYLLGGTRRRQLDVRFIAATNQDLEFMTKQGSFRKDLFFRLNVARVDLPALRERKDDISLLVDHYSRRFSLRTGNSMPAFSDEALRCLLQYDWPGNVRELKNVVENIFLGPGLTEVRPEHLPVRLRGTIENHAAPPLSERDRLLAALSSTEWNKSKAAERLQWSRMTVYRKMEKYRISKFPSAAHPLEEARAAQAV